jgi:cellobiose dehydrogenase (acceptor)
MVLMSMQTDIQVSHPDIVFYDFYAAYNSPVAADKDAYLSSPPLYTELKSRTNTVCREQNRHIDASCAQPGADRKRMPSLGCHIGLLTGFQAWTQHTPSDGIVRHIQWQARIEGNTKSTVSTPNDYRPS